MTQHNVTVIRVLVDCGGIRKICLTFQRLKPRKRKITNLTSYLINRQKQQQQK